MTHHKVIIKITKVAAGDRITRNIGGGFCSDKAPQDGFDIDMSSGGVSRLCFITVEDFENAKKLDSGQEITASSWDAEPE